MTKNTGAIAILGGMGPEASAKMLEVMVTMAAREFEAKNCSDFPEIIVFSVPVPDFITNKKNIEKTKLILIEKVQLLNKMNVELVAMACNTAHVMLEDLQKVSRMPFISIIEAVVEEIEKNQLKSVGLLATPTTLASGLFQKALAKCNIGCAIPTEEEQSSLEEIIRKVIAGDNDRNDQQKLLAISSALTKRGAKGIVLGCTELPLIFPKEFPLPMFDSIEILSRKLLTLYFLGKNNES